AGENWTAMNIGGANATIVAIAPAPSDPGTVYTAFNNAQVFVTPNNGSSFTTITSGLPNRTVTDIAVDRADPLTAYVTLSGFGGGHVFRTVNRGQTWTNVSVSL